MEIINKEFILLDTFFNDMQEVIVHVANLLYKAGRIDSVERIVEGIFERNAVVSTYFGNGIAIPHCKMKEVTATTVVIIRNRKPMKWENADEEANLIFMMTVADSNATKDHLRIIAHIAQHIMEQTFVDTIRSCGADEIFSELQALNSIVKS